MSAANGSEWTWRLEHRNPKELKNHLVSVETYGTEKLDPDYIASVKARKVLAPCHILPDGTLLSGHRRRQAALVLDLPSIPVLVWTGPSLSEAEQAMLIRDFNRNREKTVEQKAREFELFTRSEAAAARERMETTQFNNSRISRDSTGRTQFVLAGGKAEEIAAAHVGMSRSNARKASRVVKKIDELEAEGKADEAGKLRKALNKKSVNAAHKEATNGEDQPETPFDALAAEVTFVLKVAIPKILEAAIHIERKLPPAARGRFSKHRVDQSTKTIFQLFDPLKGAIENLRKKHIQKAKS